MTFTKMTLLDVRWDRDDCGDNGSEECTCELPSELSIIINRPMDNEDIDELIEASTDTYLHCIKSVGGTKTEEIR